MSELMLLYWVLAAGTGYEIGRRSKKAGASTTEAIAHGAVAWAWFPIVALWAVFAAHRSAINALTGRSTPQLPQWDPEIDLSLDDDEEERELTEKINNLVAECEPREDGPLVADLKEAGRRLEEHGITLVEPGTVP